MEPDKRILSATGSKILPKSVCQDILLAKNPSSASVIEARAKNIKL